MRRNMCIVLIAIMLAFIINPVMVMSILVTIAQLVLSASVMVIAIIFVVQMQRRGLL